jgi:hypothetical protein
MTEKEQLKQIWDWVKDLDDEKHPHDEAYHAAVLRTKKLLKPTFDPSQEDIIKALRKENEELKQRLKEREEADLKAAFREAQRQPPKPPPTAIPNAGQQRLPL